MTKIIVHVASEINKENNGAKRGNVPNDIYEEKNELFNFSFICKLDSLFHALQRADKMEFLLGRVLEQLER